VLVGQPEMLQHLQGRGLRHWSQCRGLHVTISPMTEAESLAYIRQRVAKVALPGGPLFTEEALQAIVRHARGVPYDVNLLCATVLQAGFCSQQQPIAAALVHQVRAASVGPRPGWLGRLGLAAVGLVLTAGLLGRAPFSAGPQASRSGPAAPAHSWMEARRPASASRPEAPRLQQPAPPARAASPPDSAVGPDPGEGHVRLGLRESLEPQDMETPPVPLPRGTSLPSAAPLGMVLKSCDELKAEIQAKLAAKSLTGYMLTILASGDVHGHQIVGSCEGSTKKIALTRSPNAP